MNQLVEILIGFDIRENYLKFKDIWDSKRQKQYLLKTNVVKPQSVDVQVWDSIFHSLQIELPAWVGSRQNLWDNLDNLDIYLQQAKINQNYSMIAISQFVPKVEENHLKNLYGIKPSTISAAWDFLGYDVADAYLLSGLMNAGYTHKEHQTLKTKWANYLNQAHLFTDLAIAHEFRVLSDSRVSEHSPFSVYGIYMIGKSNKS